MFSVSLIVVLFSYVLIVFLLATVSHVILELCEPLFLFIAVCLPHTNKDTDVLNVLKMHCSSFN